jgi:pyruvate/2-oxoglutarate dehydrogenase complex dihydrolipoamide acyltransferase (E2) component
MNRTIILGGIVTALVATAGQTDELHDELVACRDLTSAVERLDCYDAAVDGREQPGSPQSTAAATTPAAAEPAATVEPAAAAGAAPAASGAAAATISQEELFGQNSDEVQRTVEEATGSERVDSISAQITRLQQYDYDKVVISLDNGQVWKQIDSSSLRLRVGDDVAIERAALGSFMLKKSGSKRTMRVSRMD